MEKFPKIGSYNFFGSRAHTLLERGVAGERVTLPALDEAFAKDLEGHKRLVAQKTGLTRAHRLQTVFNGFLDGFTGGIFRK